MPLSGCYDVAMDRIPAHWLGFLAVSFVSTVLMATYIQARGLQQYGLREFRRRPMIATYSRELAPWQRLLLWPGLLALLVSLLFSVAIVVFR